VKVGRIDDVFGFVVEEATKTTIDFDQQSKTTLRQ